MSFICVLKDVIAVGDYNVDKSVLKKVIRIVLLFLLTKGYLKVQKNSRHKMQREIKAEEKRHLRLILIYFVLNKQTKFGVFFFPQSFFDIE